MRSYTRTRAGHSDEKERRRRRPQSGVTFHSSCPQRSMMSSAKSNCHLKIDTRIFRWTEKAYFTLCSIPSILRLWQSERERERKKNNTFHALPFHLRAVYIVRRGKDDKTESLHQMCVCSVLLCMRVTMLALTEAVSFDADSKKQKKKK